MSTRSRGIRSRLEQRGGTAYQPSGVLNYTAAGERPTAGDPSAQHLLKANQRSQATPVECEVNQTTGRVAV